MQKKTGKESTANKLFSIFIDTDDSELSWGTFQYMTPQDEWLETFQELGYIRYDHYLVLF